MSIEVNRKNYSSQMSDATKTAADVLASESRSYLGTRKPPLSQGLVGVQSAPDKTVQNEINFSQTNVSDERLLNARQVADKLGVSERWVRDHTTRRSPKIRAIKLGSLVRYRRADVEVFMASLDTSSPSLGARFGV